MSDAGPVTTRDHKVKVTLVFTRVPGRGPGDALDRVMSWMPLVLLRLAAHRLGAEVTVETLAY